MSPRLAFADKNLNVFDTENEGESDEYMNSIHQDKWGNQEYVPLRYYLRDST